MTAPGAAGPKSTGVRLTVIGLLAAGVAVALYAAGRLHTPNYTISLFGQVGLDAVALKSTLSSVALGLAGLQVLLALWIYRKLPLAGSPPRPVPLVHRVIGFGLFALTVPIAVQLVWRGGERVSRGRARGGCRGTPESRQDGARGWARSRLAARRARRPRALPARRGRIREVASGCATPWRSAGR